ncbi:MAG: hypothetical protein QXL16_01180, partial [Candidatus Micrarchaeaceae archaeon]
MKEKDKIALVTGMLMILVILYPSTLFFFQSESNLLSILGLSFLGYAILYCYNKRSKALYVSTLALLVLCYLYFSLNLGNYTIYKAFEEIEIMFLFFGLFMIALFFSTIYAYLIRIKNYKYAIAVISILALISIILYTKIITGYKPDDELELTYFANKVLLKGINPYTVSFNSSLLSNITIAGATTTSNNEVIGVFDYPALAFLSYTPFFIISKSFSPYYGSHAINYQAMVFS